MRPDRSQWHNPTAYDYMTSLTVEALAWECLRRNPKYQRDFARYARAKDGKQEIENAITSRWGLRFR